MKNVRKVLGNLEEAITLYSNDIAIELEDILEDLRDTNTSAELSRVKAIVDIEYIVKQLRETFKPGCQGSKKKMCKCPKDKV